MTAYYNEFDPKKAAWLRELINADLIAPGEVDERDIWDVTPEELVGFSQHHFFAGIGVWSYALRNAGWPDDRPVWTGSCPCQPFSSAGKGEGASDDRHLWPAWFWLIHQCRPGVVFGEQVAARGGLAWLDIVQADLEGTGYAVGTLDLCAAGFGAPHKRQRLFFVGDTSVSGEGPFNRQSKKSVGQEIAAGGSSISSGMAHTKYPKWGPIHEHREDGCNGEDGRREEAHGEPRTCGQIRGTMDHSQPARLEGHGGAEAADGGGGCVCRTAGPTATPGPTNGFWRDAVWVPCRDGKARPTEPGTFPLAYGAPERVVRLRGYGDGIVSEVAEAFIDAYLNRKCFL